MLTLLKPALGGLWKSKLEVLSCFLRVCKNNHITLLALFYNVMIWAMPANIFAKLKLLQLLVYTSSVNDVSNQAVLYEAGSVN